MAFFPLFSLQEIAKYFRGKGKFASFSGCAHDLANPHVHRSPDFMNAPWLFAEAYKYRRLRECFSVSKHWKVNRAQYDL
jgi:hypothetical protein